MRSPRTGAMSPKRRRALARLGILLLLVGRGLHSSTVRLNLIAFCRIGVYLGIV